jgi:UDP-N-acetyl-D-mannosaminuronate dehydrogenase
VDEVARPADDLVVVAGVEPVALLVTAAALRAGRAVVGLAEQPDELRDMVGAMATGADGPLDTRRYQVTEDPQAGAAFSVALITEPAEIDPALSPIELHTAGLAPYLRPGSLLVVSSATAEYAGNVAAATVELLTGLRAGSDYALGYLFPPTPRARLIVSGIDAASSGRTQEWLLGLGLPVMPVMPVAAAEVVATLLARAGKPQDEH